MVVTTKLRSEDPWNIQCRTKLTMEPYFTDNFLTIIDTDPYKVSNR